MQIHIGLPSRGRPIDMVASAVSLFRLASGGNDVVVDLRIDGDDVGSSDATWGLKNRYLKDPNRVLINVSDRGPGLGELHNAVAAATPPDAAYMMWSDRISVITPNWDHELALSCMQHPNRPLWLDSIHLVGAGQVILPPLWRSVCGQPFPAIYPFWFDDTHVEELDAFVHGFPRLALASKCAGPRGQRTNRCRDIPFWVDLFTATRPQRIEQAREIAARLGVKQPDNLAQIIGMFNERDAMMKARGAELLGAFGEESEPDASYVAAKERAEGIMRELGA